MQNEIQMTAREIWYLTDHLMRKARRRQRLERERKQRVRFLKREHRYWKVRQALAVVREDNIAAYKRIQYAWW